MKYETKSILFALIGISIANIAAGLLTANAFKGHPIEAIIYMIIVSSTIFFSALHVKNFFDRRRLNK